MGDFINLNVHTNNSIMRSTIKIDALLDKVKSFGQTAIGITNNGNIYDAITFYQECKKKDIKPILGCQFDVVDDLVSKERSSETLTLIAMDNEGWINLKLLISISNKDGYYYKPRIDYKSVKKHSSGLICLSGNIYSRLSKRILEEKFDEAEVFVKELKDIFGDRLYIEVSDTGFAGQGLVNKHSRDIAQKLSIPVVGTSDVHYINKDDAYTHEVLLTISAGKKMTDKTKDQDPRGRPIFPSNEFWLKDYDDVIDIFTDSEIITSEEIAARCNVDISFDKIHMPKYPKLPKGTTSYDYVRSLIYKGFEKRNISLDDTVYVERIKKELSDIKEADLADYFLIMWDWINWAKDRDIWIGPGRGSCGGSLVAYMLYITEIDPIKYDLIWERFYNLGRKGSLADIDTDVEIEKREEILDYIRETFGQDHVCQMITFNKLTTKAVLKDVGKAFGVDFDIMNNITKDIPFKAKNLKQALKESEKLRESERKYKKIFTVAKEIEGVIKSKGSHAAAVVISDKPLTSGNIPLSWDAGNKKLTTHWDMYTLDDMKYLKMDVLGLKTLSVLKYAQKLVGNGLDIRNLPTDDVETYDTMCRGFTYGVFQLESYLGKRWGKKVSPRTILDISDLISLIRPGTLESGMADSYVEVKSGQGYPNYIHPDLEEILKHTYGALVYQEQCMKISEKIAGFNLQEADKLRKAIGKKLVKEMEVVNIKFIKGAEKENYDSKIASEIFSWIEKFADYGFNKAHGVGYGIISYWTAYMKTHHPVEYYTALLKYSDKAIDPHKEVENIINDAKLRSISVEPPLLEKGNTDFEFDNRIITFGLKYIKGIGSTSLSNINDISKCRNFNDFILNCLENSVNKTTVSGLINSGATRSFMGQAAPSRTKQRLLYSLVLNLSKKESGILLDVLGTNDPRDISDIVRTNVIEGAQKNRVPKIEKLLEEYDNTKKNDSIMSILLHEEDLLGTAISGSKADLKDQSVVSHTCLETLVARPHQEIVLGVVLKEIREVKTKKGKNPGQSMAFLRASDNSYMLDNIVMFPDSYSRYKDLLVEDSVVLIRGKLSQDKSILVDSIENL